MRAAPPLAATPHEVTDLPAPGFDIEPRFEQRYLAITICGLWSIDLTQQYRAALRRHTLQMEARGGYRGALLDASDYPIQPAAIAAQHADAMTIARSVFGVRAAVFMGGSRPRLQMARIVEQTGQRLFRRRDEAMDWLHA